MKRKKYRRKNNYVVSVILSVLIIILGILTFNVYQNRNVDNNDSKKENNNSQKQDKTQNNDKKENNTDNKTNSSTTIDNITPKPSNNETEENKNENARKGGNVKLELIGDEEITISKGSTYTDQGVKAVYDDGSDASSEVKVNNEVDTTKEGTYIVSYYVGNSVVIRTVYVK